MWSELLLQGTTQSNSCKGIWNWCHRFKMQSLANMCLLQFQSKRNWSAMNLYRLGRDICIAQYIACHIMCQLTIPHPTLFMIISLHSAHNYITKELQKQCLNKPSNTKTGNRVLSTTHIHLHASRCVHRCMKWGAAVTIESKRCPVMSPEHSKCMASERWGHPVSLRLCQSLIVRRTHNETFGTFQTGPCLSPVTDDRSLKYLWVFAPTHTSPQ